MKTTIKFFYGLAMLCILALGACDSEEENSVPDYQKAIEEKYKTLGWDKDGHSKYNNTGPVRTAGGKGWVQYYAFGNLKTAIYYFDGKGAFGMHSEEVIAYDGAGQDKFALIVSDSKPTRTGACGYNDLITQDGKEGIITCQALVYGNIYAKYKEMGRWDGPLGLPNSSEKDTPVTNPAYAKGRYNEFEKGTIWAFSTGTYALWGKALKMYAAQDWERGWLKLPKGSCDPNKADNQQTLDFQGGAVKTGPTCGAYFNAVNETVYQNGASAANVSSIPCYNL